MGNFFAYFIRSYRVTFLLIIALGMYGTYTAFTLPREATPEIKIPIAVVVTVYPGSSPRDVEELITTPIEDKIANLEGLKSLTSSSQLGVSTITAEFNAEADQKESTRILREAVDTVTDLPTEALSPQVIEVNFSDQPIITLGLSGINDTKLLSLYAKTIADEVEAISGVSQVDIIGERQEQIGVRVNPEILKSYGLSLGQIMQSLRSNNINAPFGSVETGSFGYELRMVEKYQNISDVANTPIRLQNGTTVPLSEVATVVQELDDSNSESRISVNGQKSTLSVSLNVRKKSGGNIVQIVDEVRGKVEELKNESLPKELEITAFADQAEEIRKSLSDVEDAGIETLIIVFAILWLFLGWREALLASLSVPFTLFMSFIFLGLSGATLNSISLFSLILALGLLVDDAIVVIDGIYAKRSVESLADHASHTIAAFFKPLTAGTLTTVAAFFPMLLVSGIIGQFLRTIPIVITATLLSSLFVAVALLPAVAVRFFGVQAGHQKERTFTIYFEKFNGWYTDTISRVLGNRKFQNKFITTLVILMIVGLALPFTGLLKTGLFPSADVNFMFGNVELPPGSTKEATSKVMAQVEEKLRTVPEITSFVLNTGSGISTDFGGGGSSSASIGSFSANLDKEKERTSLEIMDELRVDLSEITTAKVTLVEVSSGPPSAAPIELQVNGTDLHEIDRISAEVMEEIRAIEGTVEIDRSLRNSAGEFTFTLNRDALTRYGLSATDIAGLLRTSVFGVEATNFLNEQGDEVKVEVSADKKAVTSIDQLLALPVQTQSGQTIILSEIVKVDLNTSVNTIRHKDQKRTVTVTAKVRPGINPNEATQKLQEQLAKKTLPSGYTITYGGEQQETEETFTQLYQSMIVAIILIVMIMVVEFNSYRQPFIMFLSIPLGLIGVLFGLVLLGGELNFASFIGLVSLTGIVVKNAILLVDRMNAAQAEGKSVFDAVRDAAASRFRPIILTTLTTGLGVIPLMWVDAFFRDLAMVIFTGLMFSTVLTLGLIPILYYRQQMKIQAKAMKSSFN